MNEASINSVIARIRKLRDYLDEFEKKLLQFSDIDQDIKQEVDRYREGVLDRVLRINAKDRQKIFSGNDGLREQVQESKDRVDADQIDKFGGLIDSVGTDAFFMRVREFMMSGGLADATEQDHIFLLAIVHAQSDHLLHRFESIVQSTALRIEHHTKELGFFGELQAGIVNRLNALREDHGQIMGQ